MHITLAPVSPSEIDPPSAGAAVDLTLADADGNELDMGTPGCPRMYTEWCSRAG